jgi:hypothetical protein
VRDEPGIGAFVVALRLDARARPMRALGPGELVRLRDTRKIVADRARAVLEPSTTMAPPEIHRVST